MGYVLYTQDMVERYASLSSTDVNFFEGTRWSLGTLSAQPQELRKNSKQIIEAMHTIDSITERILADTINISEKTANNPVQQADVLQRIVNIFKVS